jgi:hypothetical protein
VSEFQAELAAFAEQRRLGGQAVRQAAWPVHFDDCEQERAERLEQIRRVWHADNRKKNEMAQRLASWLIIELDLDEAAALDPNSMFVLRCSVLIEEAIALTRFIARKQRV